MPKKEQTDEEFLNLALERFKLAAEAEAENRRDSLDDLEFSIGNQWPMDIKAQRQLDGRPCLTMNRLPQFIRQVTNEQRSQRPAIQVNPIGDGADVDTAEILQGICRHIEVNSKAEIAYDTGFEYMVRGGFGDWRVLTDWISPETEDQEIFIRRIKNPFTVYWDPTAQEADYSDANWCFIVEDLLADEFKQQFPDSKYASGTASLTEYETVGDSPANWAQTVNGNPSIRIAEYFWVEQSNGATGRVERKVNWSKISGLDVLERKPWPGKWIPVVRVVGDDIIVNGRRHLAGLVRYAKDPQRAYNYWVSAATERIALAPKAPWLIAEGQTEGYERQWEQSNVRNSATLTYKPITAGGKDVGPPTRNVVEPGVQGMTEMVQLAAQDMQATTGLNDANLGQPKPDESGKAVLARQKQGDVATLNYSDNLARAINHTGRILIDLIPKVYTGPRIQRIIRPDQTVGTVGIYNSQTGSAEDAQDQQFEAANIKQIYDIGVGRYDVAVSTGPGYQSKRQEGLAAMMALVAAVPQVMPAIGDLLVGDMDWPAAKEIAKRLKKLLPPQLQDDEDNTPEAQLTKAQQQLAQLGAQHQQLVQLAQQQQHVIDTKQVEQQGKFQVAQMQKQFDAMIAKAKIDADILKAEIMTQQQDLSERRTEFMTTYRELHGSAHDLALQKMQQAHEQSLAQQGALQSQQEQQSGQAADAASQSSAQQHEAGMQDSQQGHDLGMAAVTGAQQQQQAEAAQQGE